MSMSRIARLIGGLWVVCALGYCASPDAKEGEARAAAEAIPQVVDFNFHVKPILSDRCFKCHGPDKNSVEAGLSFARQEDAFAALGDKLDHYAIVPGDVESSTLVSRIYSELPEEVMPPPESNLSLTDREKAILRRWIEQGAEWKSHWAFSPPRAPELPVVTHEDWVRNPIDRFVLAQLEQRDISPNTEATPEKLARRLYFDLTGLSPDLAELDAYLADPTDAAYAEMVDRLLSSAAFAENQTVRWLDLARYADSHGYQDDLERIMWPWRDWVIKAYRENMPYDEFVTWQLAGDLLPEPTREQIIATAFNRNHKITQEGGVIPEEYRVEYVADRTHTFGTAFLGLTMECARCHDHKYDPLAQKEYYQLFSFFNNVPEEGLIEPYGAIPKPYITLNQEEIDDVLTFIQNVDTLAEIPLMVMEELPEPRQAHILRRGAYDQLGETVEPGTPEAVLPFGEGRPPDRLGLAEWLFDPDHPLTARVAVNRIWQQLFGQGIVATPDDFGSQGNLPTHPELLDHLALKYLELDWDTRAMIKYIVSSATYRQSAEGDPAIRERDPENLLLARAPRLRLTAEQVRDHALASGGLLNERVGGPSVKPYQPPGLWEETIGGGGGSLAKYVPDEGPDRYRRSLYTFWKRTVPPPNMMTFDAASRDLCSVKRQRTSTPLQALVLLNDPQFVTAMTALARRTLEATGDDPELRIRRLFRRITSRDPAPEELTLLTDYLGEERAYFREDPERAAAFLKTSEGVDASALDPAEWAAYAQLASAIFNLDEAISRG